MTTIQERYKRAYGVLASEFQELPIEQLEEVRKNGFDLMWLRNGAALWSDYEEDESMVLDGCNQDPNHPDNLSNSVWEGFKICNLGWYTNVK